MCLRVSHLLKLFLIFCLYKVTSPLEWRIFEGQNLRYDVHSYLVKLLFHRNTEPSVGMCSGSIISCSWIITSAHCVQENLTTVEVFHGTTSSRRDLRIIAEIDKHEVYPHPDFIPNENTVMNRERDIALLRTRRPIVLNQYIKSIKLSTCYPRAGESGIIAGYGQTETYLGAPREGTVVVAECPFSRNSLLCTIGSVRAGSGDSGGPLIYKGSVVGLTSGGCKYVHIDRMCLTVYASVAANIEWIRQITNSQ